MQAASMPYIVYMLQSNEDVQYGQLTAQIATCHELYQLVSTGRFTVAEEAPSRFGR